MHLASMPPIVVATQMLSAFLQIVDMFLMCQGEMCLDKVAPIKGRLNQNGLNMMQMMKHIL